MTNKSAKANLSLIREVAKGLHLLSEFSDVRVRQMGGFGKEFWIGLAVAVLALPLGLLPVVIPMSPSLMWTLRGLCVAFIIIFIGIMAHIFGHFSWRRAIAALLVAIMLFGTSIFSYSRGCHASSQQFATSSALHGITLDEWNHYSLKMISGQTFNGVTVHLDGNEYLNCTFTDVTFDYEGKAPVRMEGAKYLGSIKLMSTDPIVSQTSYIAVTVVQHAGSNCEATPLTIEP